VKLEMSEMVSHGTPTFQDEEAFVASFQAIDVGCIE
jgi:hypothetical protein